MGLKDHETPIYKYESAEWKVLKNKSSPIEKLCQIMDISVNSYTVPLIDAEASLVQLNTNLLRVSINANDIANHPVKSFSLDPNLSSGLDKISTKFPQKSIDLSSWLESQKVSDVFQTNLNQDISSQFSLSTDGERLKINLKVPETLNCYGLGEKYWGLDKVGRRYHMFNFDNGTPLTRKEPMYQSHTFLVLRISQPKEDPYYLAVFVDRPERTYIDLTKVKENSIEIEVFSPLMDVYFLFGKDIFEILQLFTALTGKMDMPPLWALGTHQCRWGYKSSADIRSVTEKYRELKIPCDTIWCDIDYMDQYSIFTWHPDRFKDYKELINEIHAKSWKIVPIIDPGMALRGNYPQVADGILKNYFAFRNHIKGDAVGIYEGPVWPPSAVFPDFYRTQVKEWWANLISEFMSDSGVDGIWLDMNELVSFREEDRLTWPNMLHLNDEGTYWDHYHVHNAYAIEEAIATKQGILAHNKNKRPFILTRAGSPGIQKYSATWTGDNFSQFEEVWQSIPMISNLGISGQPFVGADIGGFGGQCLPPLLIRFSQLGMFYPFARNHSASSAQEPWVHELLMPISTSIIRTFYRFRYMLLPYLYTQFFFANKTGFPIWRALIAQFPEDPALDKLDTQIMIGESLLIAPIFEEPEYDEDADEESEESGLVFLLDKREIYLPKVDSVHSWYDILENRFRNAGERFEVEVTLKDQPMFVKNNSVITCRSPEQTTNVDGPETMLLNVFSQCIDETSVNLKEYEKSQLYLDAGDGFDYQEKGEYNHYTFETIGNKNSITLKIELIHNNYEKYKLENIFAIFHGIESKPTNISIDGQNIEITDWNGNVPRFEPYVWDPISTPKDLKGPKINNAEFNETEKIFVVAFKFSNKVQNIELKWN